ncbi:VOC family protein [Candidatus Parcubacteria bacterium]|nr:MAG: VOC family protein [Candidatus Parcubacteria bacterium]
MKKIIPYLWFDNQAEEAAEFYASIFQNSKVGKITRYTKTGFEVHHQPEGKAMTVEFELNGQKFIALNGGPDFKFTPAVSFLVPCETQEEIDYFWEKLSADPSAEQCGWLKDKFGLSWQITPIILSKMLQDRDKEKVERVTAAFLPMKKFNIAELQKAYEGK